MLRLWVAIIMTSFLPFTYGGKYPSILDDIFYSFDGSDLQGNDSKFVPYSLQYPFMNQDSHSIQNDPESPLIQTFLDAKFEVVIC